MAARVIVATVPSPIVSVLECQTVTCPEPSAKRVRRTRRAAGRLAIDAFGARQSSDPTCQLHCPKKADEEADYHARPSEPCAEIGPNSNYDASEDPLDERPHGSILRLQYAAGGRRVFKRHAACHKRLKGPRIALYVRDEQPAVPCCGVTCLHTSPRSPRQ